MPAATQARKRSRPKVRFGIKKVHLYGQDRCVLWSRTALDKPNGLLDLDWAMVASEARDSIMSEVRLRVLEAEVIRLRVLVEQVRVLC